MSRTHYAILNITPTAPDALSPSSLKIAYKRALLVHHPDKTKSGPVGTLYSVDEITLAYKTLLDPATRTEYDRQLALRSRQQLGGEKGHIGLETVDLDDLEVVEAARGSGEETWIKKCRCGRTYTIAEKQLEQEAEKGELYVPCEGCSLWLRVLFQADDGRIQCEADDRIDKIS